MKSKLILKTIKVPIFEQLVCVYVGNKEEVKETLEKEYNISFKGKFGVEATFFSLKCDKGYYDYIIVLKKGCKISSIVHEASHLCFTMLAHLGIYPKEEDNEVFCYVLDFIVEQILIELKSKTKV